VPLPVAVPERVGDAPVEKLAEALVVAVCGGRRGRGRKWDGVLALAWHGAGAQQLPHSRPRV
jgi:hypothetical protein